ncbi:retrovirus-related Pol polyprotein from transposon 412 [Trichonephila clavipes]|nr:retrovirus-related Pol polyprotein from transposon 412 [Trichonephila clavipes]
MAYLGKGRREDLFVLATELNLKFDKSMTIASLKDLVISSENYDEELTKNIHSTIVEDRKVREENLRIEEQKEKLRIEEREEKLRFEQLRLDEQKRKYEFELEKLRIQTQSKLGADTSKESDTKFLVKEISKFIHRFDLKEDISLYLKLFERQAQRLNIDHENWVSHLLGFLPTEVSHIIAREPDDKANLRANTSPFVKKQEYKFTEKNHRYEAPGKFEYNRKDKKFPASTNCNKHYEAPVTKYESIQRYQDSAQKGYYKKNYEKHSNHNASKHAQTNYSKSQKFKEPPKETCTLIVKKSLRTKEIFFGKVKITALIDSGSTNSKQLLDQIFWEQASISFTKEGVKFNKYENHAQLIQISAENLQEELDLRHVENRQIKKELEKLIQDYKPEKTPSTDVTMRIILKDEEPVCQHPRRLTFTERQEVNKQIEEWLNEGIIRPSSAEYASPIVMVKKKDGSSRMCIDYRKLNQKLVKDKFPLPIIEDVLDTLQEAKVYSTLDLRNGFFHVDVDEDCRKYTSFIVPDGKFEFNKVPFGLSTIQEFSNATYQVYLEILLGKDL